MSSIAIRQDLDSAFAGLIHGRLRYPGRPAVARTRTAVKLSGHAPGAVRATMAGAAGLGLLLLGRYGSPARNRRLPRAASMVVAAVLVAAGAGPALAVDATGTWLGVSSCWERTEAGVDRTHRRDGVMLITQQGEALFVVVHGTTYQGSSHDDARNPMRARGSAVRCGDDGDPCTPTSEVLDLRIRVNEARGITRIIAESKVPDDHAARRCRYRLSRTSCADPSVAPPATEVCGDGIVNDAPNEECDGAATGTPCDGACTAACTCPTSCTPLDVTGHWEGTWTPISPIRSDRSCGT